MAGKKNVVSEQYDEMVKCFVSEHGIRIDKCSDTCQHDKICSDVLDISRNTYCSITLWLLSASAQKMSDVRLISCSVVSPLLPRGLLVSRYLQIQQISCINYYPPVSQ